eukprot:5866388-Prorocentrum_lima.AAC.1
MSWCSDIRSGVVYFVLYSAFSLPTQGPTLSTLFLGRGAWKLASLRSAVAPMFRAPCVGDLGGHAGR